MVEYIMIAAGIMIAQYIYKKNEKKIKGNRGERKLCRALKKMNIPGNVKIMRDCLFRAEWGTSQVDALAITRYGIIVCEMKNHQGVVYGAVGQKNWTVKYGKSSKNMYSPVQQNHSHVSAIAQLLHDKYPGVQYLPLVVFGNKVTLHIQNSRNKVCKLNDLPKVVGRQLGPEVLSDQEVSEIASFLEKSQFKGRKMRRIHTTRAKLRADVKNEDFNLIKHEILESVKDKPVIRSDPFGVYGQNRAQENVSVPDNTRLIEKIKAAEQRQQPVSQTYSHHVHDHTMR